MEADQSVAGVAIVGGGLAGLHLARRLHAAGSNFQLFEARDRLGGRVLSTDAHGRPAADGFDLGPSWVWPSMQPRLANVLEELGLRAFPQNGEGDALFQRMSLETPQRYRGFPQEAASMRLVGGMAALIEATAARLPADRLHLGRQVQGVALIDNGVSFETVNRDGTTTAWKADQIVFALPPRLLESSVRFNPALEGALTRQWRATATWMAPHAKFVALYDRAFWREHGLSGDAQSMVGPLAEIHDATTASGQAALFGFLGVPSAQRGAMGEDALIRACLQQLTVFFGEAAGSPRATLLKDWSCDRLTATPDDQIAGGHPEPAAGPWVDGPWRERLRLAGSETSKREPGYLAGAIDAAERVAWEILGDLQPTPKALSTASRRRF